ncbi:MAG TPA: RluA family pseudouridine synthase [Longimicrobium sp.]|nr:RluA family pseudouridine synthase [Longimicrobium sp.]
MQPPSTPELPHRWTEHTVQPDEVGRRVQDILTGPMGVSRRMIQKLTRAKGLRHNRKPAWLAAKVRAGDVIAARLAMGEAAGLEPVEMELAIVHEDAEMLVIDKPPFLLVHPTAPEQDRTLAHGVAWHIRQQGLHAAVHPVHRIDRDTSGLVLFAKTGHAHHRLDVQLRAGEIRREYLALVDGVMADDRGTIDAPIARDPRNPSLRAVREGGEAALTRYAVVERFPAATLVRLELETGRTHQIRVHMRHAGHPVLGDRQYGRKGLDTIKRQALHAERLAFVHPSSGEPIELRAPLAPDMQDAVDQLRGA